MLKKYYASCLLVVSLAASCAVTLADEPPKMVVSSSRVEAKLVIAQEPKISIKDLAFSPDSTTLVTAGVLPKQTAGSETVKIRFWNTQTGQMIRELKGDVLKTDAPTGSDAYIDLSKPRFWSNPLIWADPLDEHTLEKKSFVGSLLARWENDSDFNRHRERVGRADGPTSAPISLERYVNRADLHGHRHFHRVFARQQKAGHRRDFGPKQSARVRRSNGRANTNAFHRLFVGSERFSTDAGQILTRWKVNRYGWNSSQTVGCCGSDIKEYARPRKLISELLVKQKITPRHRQLSRRFAA